MSCLKAEGVASGARGATTRDAFLGGRLTLLQPKNGPRAGIDAILLAAAVPTRPGQGAHVLEAGIGHGAASLALAARVADATVTGIEIQPRLAALARDNARLNHMDDRVRIVDGDVTWPLRRLTALGLAREGYDHVAANPPFHDAARVRAAADTATARAHAGDLDTLDKWGRFVAAMAAPKASATLIHRADALAAVLASLERRFGGLIVFPLFPRAGAAATRVIVQGVRGSRAPLTVAQGLVLHEASGAFTDAAERILRGGEALPLLGAK